MGQIYLMELPSYEPIFNNERHIVIPNDHHHMKTREQWLQQIVLHFMCNTN